VEVAPTYTSQTASHLMLGEDASFRLFSEESLLMFSGQSVAELETQLKSLAEKDTVVNLFWKPTAGNMASFVQLIELCNSLEVGYALYIEP
ncbi:MAG: hypothetical protein IKW19_03350, partial [Akkermansia sp.]|nr:hypothetical protein [Akkermansia sp.]